jgi:hypothetical protein
MHDLPVVQSAEEPSSIRSRNKLSTLNSFERPMLEICRAHWRRSHHPPLRPRKMVNDPFGHLANSSALRLPSSSAEADDRRA